MSVRTVARKDLASLRRSRVIWAAGVVLAMGAAFAAFAAQGYLQSPASTVQEFIRTLSMGIGILLPIVALVASYLAIAGERRSGGIKFLLSVPNTRREVFLGKLVSRLALLTGGLVLAFGGVAAAALAGHGVLPIESTVGLFALSLAYAWIFVSVAVALSAGIASRSRAIAAAVGAYFVLVILAVVPNFRLSGIVEWIHRSVLDMAPNQNLYDAVNFATPYVAFRKATNLAFPPELERRVFYRDPEAAGELPGYLQDEAALVVFAAWLLVPPVLGYLRFARADLE